MKIALCLQGQPRIYKQGYDFLNTHLLSKYDVDVFGHTWWSEKEVGQYYDSAPWAPHNYRIEEDLPKKLNDLYHFKLFKYEESKSLKPTKKYNVGVPEQHDRIYDVLKSRYYSLKEVLTLLNDYENNNDINYEWTIISRYDIGIFSPLPDISSLNSDKIYLSDYHKGRKYIFNDNFWIFGKHKYIFKNLYDDFDKTYDMIQQLSTSEDLKPYENIVKNTELLNEKNLSGEIFMAFYLLFNGLLENVIQDPILNYNLIR
jgi:hypothetical protein